MGIVQSRYNDSSAAGGGNGGGSVGIGMRDTLGIKTTTSANFHQQGTLGGPHTRSGSIRAPPRQPMPDTMELERRFTKVLVSQEYYFYFTSQFHSS
uniref:Uncharacterized protein n=1 Tax=Bracon brevicornis TaxID=1563983 RepID=A0A6V7J396_9HYME